MKLHAKLYTSSRRYCLYPHQAGLFQVQYLLRYLRNKVPYVPRLGLISNMATPIES